jgi:hypothetical protein
VTRVADGQADLIAQPLSHLDRLLLELGFRTAKRLAGQGRNREGERPLEDRLSELPKRLDGDRLPVPMAGNDVCMSGTGRDSGGTY